MESIEHDEGDGEGEAELFDLEDFNEGDSTTKKHGRGRSKRWAGWGKEKKIIDWNDASVPVGENAAKLMSHLGTYVRNGTWFPLSYTSWDALVKEREVVLEAVWNDVKAKTNTPDEFKGVLYKKLNLFWKSFKSQVKRKYYTTYNSDEERLAFIPPHVKKDQWSILVRYWSLEETQIVAAQNSENRENLCAHPRIGRKSIPVIVHKRKENNEPYDKLTLWRVTRSKKGKYDENDGAADLEETIQRRLEELPEEEREYTSKRDKIFKDIIGSDGHGRVLCARPSQTASGASSTNNTYETELAQLHLRDKEREAEIAELRSQREAEIAELRAQNAELRAQNAQILQFLQSAGFLIPGLNPALSPRYSGGHGSNSRVLDSPNGQDEIEHN